MSEATTRIDPVTAQVIQGRLDQIALEMSRKLVRMSFSIIIKESEDIGVALVDRNGWQLAEADTTPLQMGPIPWYVQGIMEVLEERGEEVRPGDVFVHNDPYLGASHAPDVGFFVPVFHRGELVAWSGTTAHHLEIGCSKPGTSVLDAVDEWAGGLRLRALKIREEGRSNDHLWKMIADNVRIPRMVIGDMQAQIAACEQGADRLVDLMEEVGREAVSATQAWFEDYSERMLRAEIEALPDGEYSATGYADGFDEDPDPSKKNLKIVVTLRVKGSELEVDLTGTHPQIQNMPLNMPLQGTVMCSIFTVVRSVLLDSADHEPVPQNRGIARPLTVTAPKGSLANPEFPAPTLARLMPACTLTDTLLRAFAEVVPERCCAGTGALAVFSLSGVKEGEYWIHMDIHEGSYGGRAAKDGMDAMDTLFTNTRCAPIEEIETEFPLRCRRWELNDDPVGHGRFRGGKGGIRDWEYLSGGYFSSEADGHLTSPWGLAGGHPGAPAQMWVNPGDSETEQKLSSKQPGRTAEQGQIFRAVAPNGGGFGNPLERDPEMVLGDWLDEIITLEEATSVYGVVIDDQTQTVQGESTARRRREPGVG